MTRAESATDQELIAKRRRPMRRDSRETMQAILDSAAHLLEDVGFEDLSTNMICRHAGLTPPALYHYFPNKYAILFELAHTLLGLQHNELNTWIAQHGLMWTDTAAGVKSFENLQVSLRAVADAQVGALWIMRGMRAIPRLREVRIVARDAMAEHLLTALCERHPKTPRDQLAVPSFLIGEMIHMGAELELDQPERDQKPLRASLALALVTFVQTLEVDKPV